MRLLLVVLVLVVVALIHALPLIGVLGGASLTRLYGVTVDDPTTEILLRHRAVLFGVLAVFLGGAAFHPPWHGAAIAAGSVSVVTFLVLARQVGHHHAALDRVILVDVVATVLLIAAAAVHLVAPHQT